MPQVRRSTEVLNLRRAGADLFQRLPIESQGGTGGRHKRQQPDKVLLADVEWTGEDRGLILGNRESAPFRRAEPAIVACRRLLSKTAD